MQETSNPLDLAIAGTGFFTVQRPDGSTAYTRDGGFHADVGGSLRARDGSAVLDTNNQQIQIPSAPTSRWQPMAPSWQPASHRGPVAGGRLRRRPAI